MPVTTANIVGKTTVTTATNPNTPVVDERLICESLVREIAEATRWSAIEDAWRALVHVRHMAEMMRAQPQVTMPMVITS